MIVANDSTSFWGRDAELLDIERAVAASPFVLLHGPGGAGKTRLSRRFMARWEGKGTVFCDLSAARTKADLVAAVATAIGIALGSEDSEHAADQIGYALEARTDELVVLDNLESVPDCASVLARWAFRGPRWLATSRIKVGLEGEVDIDVGPLDEDSARALFIDRARMVRSELVPDDDTDALIEKLGRSPLAIELAAARAHVLEPKALLERFASHIDLLRSQSSALPERHRSLRAVVDGSWSLCDEPDRRALAAASVFRGNFDLAAAESVLGADAADRVESLLASALVHRIAVSEGPPRFALYEAVREFAAEKLGEDVSVKREAERRHAEHYRALAERLAERAANAEPRAFWEIGLATDNLVAAYRVDPRASLAFNHVFARVLTADAHVETLMEARTRIADDDFVARAEVELALARAVRRRGHADRVLGHATEGERFAVRSGRAALIADGAYTLTMALFDTGNLVEAKAHGERAIVLAEACGAHALTARSFDQLGFCVLELGDTAMASRCAERAIAIAQTHGFGLIESFAENLMGAIYGRRAELVSAEEHFERGLGLARRLGYTTQEAIVLGNLAKVSMLRGDVDKARTLLGEALSMCRKMGLRKGEATHLANLAMVEAEAGRLAEARALAAHAEQLASEVHHHRQSLVAALLLGTIALEEGRAREALHDFDRALAAATALGRAPGRASAMAGQAAARALAGELEMADGLVAEATLLAGLRDSEASAIVEARRALVLLARAEHASQSGALDEARALVSEGEAVLDATEAKAAGSTEVRLVRRLALAKIASHRSSAAIPDRVGPRSTRATVTFELVTRSGRTPATALPPDADLAFDAIGRMAIVEGAELIDLRKKPIAARLLEVVLGEPDATFDKARLFRDVWRSEFRNASQGATLYKAIDRLARLLHEDPRRFLRWDQDGSLVLVAQRPALLRIPGESPDRA